MIEALGSIPSTTNKQKGKLKVTFNMPININKTRAKQTNVNELD
jgi:hypothetical protein